MRIWHLPLEIVDSRRLAIFHCHCHKLWFSKCNDNFEKLSFFNIWCLHECVRLEFEKRNLKHYTNIDMPMFDGSLYVFSEDDMKRDFCDLINGWIKSLNFYKRISFCESAMIEFIKNSAFCYEKYYLSLVDL